MCYPKLADVHSDVRGDVSRRADPDPKPHPHPHPSSHPSPHPNRNPQPNPNPNPNLNPSPSPNQAVVAFDLMTMPLRLLPALPALTPALLCVFAEELDDDAAGSATANAITRMVG